MKLVIPGLYFVTPPISNDLLAWLHLAKEAVLGGATMVQIRDKISDKGTIINAAHQLHPFLRIRGVPLIINDHVDIAAIVGADGIHVGQQDSGIRSARQVLGEDSIIGISLERQDQLSSATGADYIAVSPLFSTTTKVDIAEPWGLEGLKGLRKATRLPIVAIGGIKNDHVATVLNAGADIIAVITAITKAPCPRQATEHLKLTLDGHKGRNGPKG